MEGVKKVLAPVLVVCQDLPENTKGKIHDFSTDFNSNLVAHLSLPDNR